MDPTQLTIAEASQDVASSAIGQSRERSVESVTVNHVVQCTSLNHMVQ